MSTTIDLYFRTSNRADFESDLLALGLLLEIALPDRAEPQIVPIDDGIAIDYVGPLIDQPALIDTSVWPPAITTPPTYYPGERAALRLTGPLAEQRAQTIAAASMAHTLLLDPADVPAAQMRWAGGSEPWTGQTSVPPPPPDPALDLDAQKTRLIARLAQRRWEVETAGITFAGLPIRTDDRSKLMLLAAADHARRDPEWTTRWKTPAGWVDLTAAQIIAAADAVLAHVQACFAREAELAAQITTADATTLPGLSAQVEAFTP